MPKNPPKIVSKAVASPPLINPSCCNPTVIDNPTIAQNRGEIIKSHFDARIFSAYVFGGYPLKNLPRSSLSSFLLFSKDVLKPISFI